MATDLMVDTEFLEVAGARLAALAQVFDTANVTARDLGAVLGAHDLAQVVAGFAMGWDEIRIGMVKDVRFLGEACGRIGDTFAELDETFGAKLVGAV